jgi:hypothetical protein
MTAKKITYKQFIMLLGRKPGAVILRIQAKTDARARKTGNPHGTIFHYKDFRCITGVDYEKTVNRQLTALGKKAAFEADKLPYGKFVVGNKIIKTDRGDYQLRIVERNPRPPLKDQFLSQSGKVLPQSEVIKYVRSQMSLKQVEHGLRGKKQVKCRNYSFKNIISVFVDKKQYVLVP